MSMKTKEVRKAAIKAGDYPGDVIVDVGANIGVFTVIASKLVGSRGRVVAIEPNSESAKRLERNIALNSLGHRISSCGYWSTWQRYIVHW
jgi:FkbM family methyltransferase